MKWILAVWFCGISAMADAQVTESLKAIGMENIQCAQTPGVTTVSFENNVYRSTYTGVGKAIDACLGSETKGDLQLVVLENRIPRLCINLPDTLTAAYRNGEISLTQVYQQMGITVDTDPAMKALKNAGQEEVPSAWKVDLVIYPDLFLENNTFDELYTYAINLNPAVEMALWKGGKMTAQVILPGYHVVVGLPYAVAVLLVYLREIAFVAYRKRSFVLQDRLSGGGFDRFVDVAEDGAVVQVAFPRNDVGHVERQRELVVDRVQFLLRLVQRGAVQTEDVDVVGQVRAAQNHFEKDVQRFVVEGIGDGPVFRQDDVHEPQELGERIGEKFAPPFADDLIPGQERPFEVGVYVAEFRIGGIVFLVEYDPFLNVDDRHPVEQVRIFYLAFRFPSAGRFDLSHDADAPLLEEDDRRSVPLRECLRFVDEYRIRGTYFG